MKKNMIPKVIHYCWFGGNPLPKSAKKCIESWKKYFPDYKIIQWDESNFDINACDYVKEAYEAQKWAFVSDYARFLILYEKGGIYFDTDVEVIRPFDDILDKGGFMGVEQFVCDKAGKHDIAVAPGLGLAVEPGLELYAELIEQYHSRHFKNEDGGLNLTTIVKYTTDCLKQHGLQNTNTIQQIAGIYIYPKQYFNPCDMDTGKIIISNETRSIHHYTASWEDPYSIFRGKVFALICRLFGKKVAGVMRKIVGRK